MRSMDALAAIFPSLDKKSRPFLVPKGFPKGQYKWFLTSVGGSRPTAHVTANGPPVLVVTVGQIRHAW
jgi:hypothetical protein